MRKILALLSCLVATPAAADYAATQGAGTNFGSGVVSTVHYPRMLWCDPTTPTQCVAVDSSGRITLVPNQAINNAQINGVTPLMGNGVTGTGSQRVTIASDNTAFSVNAASTLAAETTKVIGTVRNLGNAGGITDFAGQNASSPASSWLVGCQFNTTPTTITSGNASPCQLDNAGNLKVNIVAGASSGAVAQGSTTSGQTGGLMQGAATTAAPSYSNATTNPLSLTTTGDLRVSVTNTNANGQAALASSSPVAIAKNSGTGSTVAGAAVGTAGTASTEVITVQGIASGTPQNVVNGAADPCQTTANSTARINIGSATTTRIITPSASNKTYICSVDLFAFAANNVAIVEGTGGTCGTGTAGVVGGTTTATGISFPAQGGLAKGGAGFFVWNTAGTNVDFCLITSTTGPLTGFVKYVQAP